MIEVGFWFSLCILIVFAYWNLNNQRKNFERGKQLDDYADRLSSWETGQKVRSVAFVKFWRRCEKAAGLDPGLGERFEALVEEFRLEDEGDE